MLGYTQTPNQSDKEYSKKVEKKIAEGLLRGTMTNYQRCKLEESKLFGDLFSYGMAYRPHNPW